MFKYVELVVKQYDSIWIIQYWIFTYGYLHMFETTCQLCI